MYSPKTLLALVLMLATATPVQSLAQEQCPKGLRIRQLEQQEAELRQLAEIYRASGMGSEYQEILRRIRVVQDEIPTAHLEQGLALFRLTRQPGCALYAYNYITGMTLDLQPFTDGTWNFLSGGKVVREALTDADLLAILSGAL